MSCHVSPWHRKPLVACGRDVTGMRWPKLARPQSPPGYFLPSSFQEKEKEFLLQSDQVAATRSQNITPEAA